MHRRHWLIIILLLVSGVLAGGGLAGQDPAPESSAIFMVEVPEAQIQATNQPTVNLPSSDLKLILIHVLRPDADNIDYGQIYPRLNGAAAARVAEVRPGIRGKVVRLSLKSRPGFELLPGNNAVEIQAIDHAGHSFKGSFNLHTPAGVCLGGGRARILGFQALFDLLRAGVTINRLIELVVDCGVNFQPTADSDQKLQDAGADPKLLAAIHHPASPEFSPAAVKALTIEDLTKALRSGVESERLIDEVQKNGVRLTWNDETEQTLRAAGASGKLVVAVREMAGVKADRVAPKAMTLPELLELLRGGVPNNRLMDLVKERGIKFRLTPDAERQLRQAGAYEKLIIAIREVAP